MLHSSMKKGAGVMLVASLLVVTSATSAQNLPELARPSDVPAFIDTYYQHPRPEMIARALELLPASPDLKNPGAAGPTIAFFSEVFIENPDRVAEWKTLIDKQQDVMTKFYMTRALDWAKDGGVLKIPGHSAGINDLYWGAFFASGKAVFIERLLEETKGAEQLDDFNLWGAGFTAKWSLSSNSRQHPVVRSILENEKKSADKRTQDLIEELLTKDPGDYKREANDIYAKQKAAGKWN